jgi:hypothetical protein
MNDDSPTILQSCQQMILTENKEACEKYNQFVNETPTKLPPTEIIQDINKKFIQLKQDINEGGGIENYKKNELYNLFNVSDIMRNKLNDITNYVINDTLNKNANSNLHNFLTKVIFYTFAKSDVFKDNMLDITKIKTQLGKDLHRIKKIRINGVDIPKQELLKFADVGEYDKEVDFYNLLIMNSIDKQNIPINLNTINIIDICSIQQIIQFVSDLFLSELINKGILQQGGDILLNIVLTKENQYIEFGIISNLLDRENPEKSWGKFDCVLKMNLFDLSYSVKLIITNNTLQENQQLKSEPITRVKNEIVNISKNVADFTKENPGSVAAGVGVTTVLASGVGTLLAIGLLGGKTKKRLYKKRTIQKTKQTYKKRSGRKTKRKNNRRKRKTSRN